MHLSLLTAVILFPQAPTTPAPGPGQAPDLLPRRELAPEPVRALPLPDGVESRGYRLVIKFRDPVRARAAQDGTLTGAFDLSVVRELAEQRSLHFRRAIELPFERLTDLEQRASERTGRAQPDLAGMLVVVPPEGADDPAQLEALGRELQALPEIEWASIETLGTPPPGDLAPTTNDYTGLQTYVEALGVDQLLTAGIDGTGVRLADCEYGWEYEHEDLNELDLHPEPGQTIHPNAVLAEFDEHGTAVIGVTSAMVNAYGCSGMTPGAEIYTFPEWTLQGGFRRLSAVTHAIVGSGPGDVVMLEMQDQGGPAELNLSIWTVCKTGVDAGVVVVGAAGNGGLYLDGSSFDFYTNRGDSGAILVGAGDSLTHTPFGWSTHGTRINVQGWGHNVTTLGYGTLILVGGDDLQDYAISFGGTSSATPLVASAAVLLQSAALAQGAPLDPLVLREALIQNGIPQAGTQLIGPFPDVPATLQALFPCSFGNDSCIATANSTGSSAGLRACGSTSVAANEIELTLSDLPAGQPGLVYYGESQVQTPFGNGFRCVGGLTARLPITSANATGALTTQLDISAPPTPDTRIQPGSTWHFQGWYRDPAGGGAQFNLSDALTLVFTP